jgi:uroporphyrinogen decarboxylase
MAGLPVDILSVDWRQPLSEVRRIVGPRVLQDNLDSAALLAAIPEIQCRTAVLIEQEKGGRHIMNLGYGILPMVPMKMRDVRGGSEGESVIT